MNLQQRIGELQTMALAYPSTTPIQVRSQGVAVEITAVAANSDESGITIQLEVAR